MGAAGVTRTGLLLVLTVTLAASARADTSTDAFVLLPEDMAETISPSESAPPAGGGAPFDEGTWSLQLSGAFYHDYFDNSLVEMGYGTVGISRYFEDRWAWIAQVSAYDVQQDRQPDAFAGSFELMVRTHLLVRDPFSVFIDGGAGYLLADRRAPAGGTASSYTLTAGAGLTLRIADDTHLFGGARWFHISNARRRGRERNPHTDGGSFFFGVMFNW